jgi:hypothetical protein
MSLTWYLTQTFDHDVPLAALAEASGYTTDEIAANPAVLVGVAGERLAELLTSYPAPDDAVGGREVGDRQGGLRRHTHARRPRRHRPRRRRHGGGHRPAHPCRAGPRGAAGRATREGITHA